MAAQPGFEEVSFSSHCHPRLALTLWAPGSSMFGQLSRTLSLDTLYYSTTRTAEYSAKKEICGDPSNLFPTSATLFAVLSTFLFKSSAVPLTALPVDPSDVRQHGDGRHENCLGTEHCRHFFSSRLQVHINARWPWVEPAPTAGLGSASRHVRPLWAKNKYTGKTGTRARGALARRAPAGFGAVQSRRHVQ